MKKFLALALMALSLVTVLSAASFAEKPGVMGFGVLSGGVPTVRYYFTKDLAGEAGLTFMSVGSNTTAAIVGAVTNDFLSGDKVKLHWGGGLVYQTAPGTNSFTLEGLFGAEAFIFPKLSLTIDIIPAAFTITNTNGQQTNTLTLGSATNTIISSFHFYL